MALEFKDSYMLNKHDTELFYPTAEFKNLLEFIWDIADTDRFLKHCASYGSGDCEAMLLRTFKSCIREELVMLCDDLKKWVDNGCIIESGDKPGDD